ncbi:hypothetical protein RDV64_00990 [Acuticoccus sp. MNP-M23]|uniref:hypothetical protein n=1 Tax=Acuticoccus sp. MNP-M23 TaxID=3072793 RepID=UPI002815F873|nr:hypothetical protein [Acuticoccus sp. MNP-M23]WMS43009.1 hypothetical protein RDV64_00990 [Acuticoccus sp. MNP-M23]
MAIHCVFISSTTRDGSSIDATLRQRFSEVYRVGVEFWLVDTAHDADYVATSMRSIISGRDKLFVAAMTRDFVPVLSAAAQLWLTAPNRSWRLHGDGCGQGETTDSPFRAAA